MSLHINRLRLTQIDTLEPDIEKAILIIAENDTTVASILNNCLHILGGQNQLMSMLRTLDARHLTDYNIYKLLVESFDGIPSENFFDYIFHQMPCQICGEIIEFEPLMEKFERIYASHDFFAKKFSSNNKFDPEFANNFGVSNAFDSNWQNSVHQMSKTSRIFRASLPIHLERVEIAVQDDQRQGKLLNAKSKHGTIIK